MSKFEFTWDDSFETGVESVDLQHLELIKIINELAISYFLKKQKEVIVDILFKLEDYTVYHFSEEEKLVSEGSTIISEEHIKEHEHFIKKIRELKFDYVSDDKPIAPELFDFLKNWLINHILGVDKKELSIE